MASYVFDLKPCSRLTVGAIGPAGQRTFYLQGIKGRQVVSLVIEKQQAQALAIGIDELLEEVEAQYPEDRTPEPPPTNLSLLDPVTPRFRIGRLGLGFEAEDDTVARAEDEGIPLLCSPAGAYELAARLHAMGVR